MAYQRHVLLIPDYSEVIFLAKESLKFEKLTIVFICFARPETNSRSLTCLTLSS